MNNQASRVAVVNQVSRQLMHSGHPSEKEIKSRQDKLNTRCPPPAPPPTTATGSFSRWLWR